MSVPEINIEAISLSVGKYTELSAEHDAVLTLQQALSLLTSQCRQPAWDAECQTRFNDSLNQLHRLAQSVLATAQPEAEILDIQAFPLAVWATRQGAEIDNLGPVVHALAQLANQLKAPEDLRDLFAQVEEIYTAISPQTREDREQEELGRPWRILLLNRAIIATRSLQPELMETAFNTLAHYLPQDLGDFLQEGIRQLDIVGYPAPVREIMQSYHRQYGAPQTLH